MPKILDGKKLAQEIELILQQAIESGLEVAKRRPGLAVLRVGDDPASGVYVNYKEKACDRIGVSCLLYTSPSPRDRTRSRMPSSA